MSGTWYSDAPPPSPSRLTVGALVRAVARGVALVVLLLGGLVFKLVLRLIEKPLFGERRPVTPAITVFVCRVALRILGLKLEMRGRPVEGQGAVVANHSSWLDILVLNANKRIYFVSKAEVATWPGVGLLARATGTVFIERNRAKATSQADLFRKRLAAGHRLLFFPEGTSSDNRRVLPFKSTLFEAFRDDALRDTLEIQPVSVVYEAPPGRDPRFFAWWGDMDLGPHLVQVLAFAQGGRVHLRYQPPLPVRDYSDRKALATACEKAVRLGYEEAVARIS